MNTDSGSDLAAATSTAVAETFGDRLKRQRLANYLTQEQLAAKLAVRQSTIARWEAGECVPALRHRRALAEALIISPSILFEGVAA